MEVQIKYKDIIDRCEQLSSFEARGKVDANGQSRYLDIHIGEIDHLLINQYIEQARTMLEEKFDRMITDTYEEGGKPVYEFDRIVGTGEMGTFDPKITDEIVDLSGMSTKVYFLEAPRTFGIYVDDPHGAYDGKVFINDKVLGDKYKSDPYDERIYVASNGKMYSRTDGNLIPYVQPEHSFTWTIRTDTRWSGVSAFTKHVSEAITSYAMAQWLSGRLDERVQFYETLFASSLTMATKNIFTKQAP